MSREDAQFKLRLPDELKKKIEDAAKENRRSMNAEILARLQESFDDVSIDWDLPKSINIKFSLEPKGNYSNEGLRNLEKAHKELDTAITRYIATVARKHQSLEISEMSSSEIQTPNDDFYSENTKSTK